MTERLITKMIVGLLLISYGFWRRELQKKNAKRDQEEFERIKDAYAKRPLSTGFLDSLIALFGSGSPKVFSTVYASFFSWGPILMGTAAFLDGFNELIN